MKKIQDGRGTDLTILIIEGIGLIAIPLLSFFTDNIRYWNFWDYFGMALIGVPEIIGI